MMAPSPGYYGPIRTKVPICAGLRFSCPIFSPARPDREDLGPLKLPPFTRPVSCAGFHNRLLGSGAVMILP